MPLTYLAHQVPAFALKLARPRWFDGTALALGTMSPDWAYALEGSRFAVDAHTWPGLLLVAVPAATAATLAIRPALPALLTTPKVPPRPDTPQPPPTTAPPPCATPTTSTTPSTNTKPAANTAPTPRAASAPLNARAPRTAPSAGATPGARATSAPLDRRPPFLLTVTSALVGVLTHVGWDSFTHPGLWGARLLFGDSTTAPKVAQLTSTTIGILVGAALLILIVRRSDFRLPPRRVWVAAGIGAAIGAVWGLDGGPGWIAVLVNRVALCTGFAALLASMRR